MISKIFLVNELERVTGVENWKLWLMRPSELIEELKLNGIDAKSIAPSDCKSVSSERISKRRSSDDGRVSGSDGRKVRKPRKLKLSKEDALKVREMYFAKDENTCTGKRWSMEAIAKQFRVSQATIQNVLDKKKGYERYNL